MVEYLDEMRFSFDKATRFGVPMVHPAVRLITFYAIHLILGHIFFFPPYA